MSVETHHTVTAPVAHSDSRPLSTLAWQEQPNNKETARGGALCSTKGLPEPVLHPSLMDVVVLSQCSPDQVSHPVHVPLASNEIGTNRRPTRLDPELGVTNAQDSEEGAEPNSATSKGDVEQLRPRNETKVNDIDQATHFWEKYNRAADFEDKEFVEAQGSNLDTHLIFAGLFAGVNTAFVLESIKTLQPDQGERTNRLIRSVILSLQNITVTDNLPAEDPFEAPRRSVRCTIIFFSSLCCSLTAAFGAVLGKQWLNRYMREGVLMSPPMRARERQRKFEGREWWHLEGIIETLPTLLQISLFLFLIGLIDFLLPIHSAVAEAVIGFSLVPTFFYIVTIGVVIASPGAPFQTRLPTTIHQAGLRLIQTLSGLPQVASYLFDKFLCSLHALGFTEESYVAPTTLINSWTYLTTLARPLRRSMLPVQRKLLIFLSHLRDIFRKAWQAARATRVSGIAVDPTRANNSNEMDNIPADVLLNIRCMIFSIERASSLTDVAAILPALDTLVQSLNVDYHHPIAAPFTSAVASYILKPILHSTDKQGQGLEAWMDANIEFRYLLRVLHLLYCRWSKVGEFTLSFRVAVGKELWATFSRDPLNTDSITLILDIMKLPDLWHWGLEGWSDSNLDLLFRCLRLQTSCNEDYLPYISLLAQVDRHRTAHSYAYHRPACFDWGDGCASVAHALSSTMWTRSGPDLDYWRGWLRVEILPGHSDDRLVREHFAKYLKVWFKKHVHDGKQHPVQWPYLQALSELLLKSTDNRFWEEQLEENEHIMLLLQIAKRTFPSSHTYEIVDRQANALAIFTTMWHRSRMQHGFTPPEAGLSQYMTIQAVQTIVEFWNMNLTNESLERRFLGDWTEWMEHTVLYFEEASRLNLLTRRMVPVVEGYKRNGDGFGQWASGHDRESYRQQRQSLFDRVDRLRFVD